MFGGETWKKEHERKVGEIGNLGSHLKKKTQIRCVKYLQYFSWFVPGLNQKWNQKKIPPIHVYSIIT